MSPNPRTELLNHIRDLIFEYFDREEFRDLCFKLGERYDDLREERLTVQIREFVLSLDRKKRLDDLLSLCSYLRPNVGWPDLSNSTKLDPSPTSFTNARHNPNQIFLSHAGQDAEFAHKLAADLRRHGWEIWIAPDSIRPGEEWVDAINNGLAGSGIFLLVLTPEAIKSRWVYKETNVAINLQNQKLIRLIPLQLKTVNAPPLWQDYQWIRFQGAYKNGLELLLRELQPEKVGKVSELYRTMQGALGRREWAEVLRIGKQIESVYPDYRETETLIASAHREIEREQAQQEEVEKLYTQLQDAIGVNDWATVKKLAVKIERLIPAYKDVSQLGERARKAEKQAKRKAFQEQLQKIPGWIWIGGGIVCVTLLVILFPWENGNNAIFVTSTMASVGAITPAATTTPAPIVTEEPTLTATQPTLKATPSNTPSPSPSPTAMPSSTFTPTPDPRNFPPENGELGDEWIRPKDGMVMVFVPPPSEPFVLENGDTAPTVGYWIDKYEVSNAQYKLCVDAGVCEAPISLDDGDEYPVASVSWFDAKAYGEWAGGTLPTDAEWLYAAIGEATFNYPWGNEFDGTKLNFCDQNCNGASSWDDGYRNTAPVGNYPTGASWVGALDMAGNVHEWTDSLGSGFQILRGFSWIDEQGTVEIGLAADWGYYATDPSAHSANFGFRLVMKSNP
ncbi:MAG: SUMF1/EgtB/PvdO family nonheme iron enzyme [Ardenticatenaceae bacterium]|nr:SUMF1/EgtB/PvdO family nonheme iron enzyme [Ardenticatenaceae bacterium]